MKCWLVLLLLLLSACGPKLPPVLNIPALANQPPLVVDQALGRPYDAKPTSEDPTGQWRSYTPPGTDDVLVRFHQNRAVSFTVTLKQPSQFSGQAVSRIGIHVTGIPTSETATAATWAGTFNGIDFAEVTAAKLSGEGFGLISVKTR